MTGLCNTLYPLSLSRALVRCFPYLKISSSFQLGWQVRAKNSFRSSTPQLSLARGRKPGFCLPVFEKSVNPEARGVSAKKWPGLWAKQIAQPARNVPLLFGASQKSLRPGLTFIPSLPVPADLKKEKLRATQKSFHSVYRSVHGGMSLCICFKILPLRGKGRGGGDRREINE